MADVVWRPSPERIERANVTRLMRRFGCSRYMELHRISVEEPERFWPAVVEDLGLVFSRRWDGVVDTSDGIEWARWLVGARLNLADSAVHRWADERPADEAAVFLGENGDRRTRTFADLSREVRQLAEALVELGVEPGDRVGILMPMSPEVAVASHACSRPGCSWERSFSASASARSRPGLSRR